MTDKLGQHELNTVILGNCLEVLRGMPDNSVNSVITDPPYGLSKEPDMVEVLTHWLNGDDYEHQGGGFMGRDWDSFVPGPAIWREVYRVMKPGGCLMAFGGTRTVDLLSVAIRLAGFEKFDQCVWLHGQGFAKGCDISKKLDELAGVEREVVGEKVSPDGIPYSKRKKTFQTNGSHEGWQRPSDYKPRVDITAPATEAAKLWDGYKSGLKPAHEVILCFWKPREGTYAENALAHGVAGLWIDGARIATGENLRGGQYSGIERTNGGANGVCYGEHRNLKPEDYKQPSGRYPANVLISHSDRCVKKGMRKVKGITGGKAARNPSATFPGAEKIPYFDHADSDGLETVEDWKCVEDCPIRLLDQQAGVRKSGDLKKGHRQGKSAMNGGGGKIWRDYGGDTGSASRFFYSPKAPGREKWFYCQICDDCYPYKERDDHAHDKPKGKRKHQIAHPTVKPLKITNHLFGVLEYLCRLTKTPTGGIVLDPFAGSGTTGLAALENGRDFILIENDPIYHKIATKRLKQAMEQPRQLELLK